MEKLTITEQEYLKAKADRAGMEALLNTAIARARREFWAEAHPTIVWMVAEAIPFLTAVQEFLLDKPELQTPEFIASAFIIKAQNKALTPFEVMEQAAKRFKVQSENVPAE